MAYDSESDRIILQGGRTFYTSDETWAYDFETNTWTNMDPDPEPPELFWHAMEYDQESDRTIAFGEGETWAYDFNTNTWTNLMPTTAPGVRYWHNMAYDAQSDRIILFGGHTGIGGFFGGGGTWAYDFNTNTWTKMNPATSPFVRAFSTMEYDVESDRVILFGSVGAFERETWAYDFETDAWEPMKPMTQPRPGSHHVMSYDVQSDRIILFGGGVASYQPWNQTWAYDYNSNTWTRTAANPRPPAKLSLAIAYDAQSDRTIIFGGESIDLSDDTWAYDFDTDAWQDMTPGPRPHPRVGHALAYDVGSDRVVQVGGWPWEPAAETWAYDSDTNLWVEMTSTIRPPVIVGHDLAYDGESDRVVLFGGWGEKPVAETWIYDLDRNQWSNVTLGLRPPERGGHAMAYDTHSDRVILFGGCSDSGCLDDTWVYHLNKNTWTEVTPPLRPTPRIYHAMAYDAKADRVIVVGGSTPEGLRADTWSYDVDSNTWTELTPPISPIPREQHAMAYDSVSGRMILFGGYGDGRYLEDTWVYDFQANLWTDVSTASGPYERGAHKMAYDVLSDRVVLFGGNANGDETWWYELPGPRPSKPRDLRALAGDGKVSLGWRPPASDGGSPLLGYRIYRGARPAAVSPLAILKDLPLSFEDVLGYTDENVTNGVTYFYRVSAVSANGVGPMSNEVSATPRCPIPPDGGRVICNLRAPTPDRLFPAGRLILRSPMSAPASRHVLAALPGGMADREMRPAFGSIDCHIGWGGPACETPH